MNVELDPAVELALRKQVERIVRPVHAGKDRKLAMREELLGHLVAIYVEERARRPNDQAAVAQALQRFGQPADLTAELDASVGFASKIAYHVDRREDALNRVLRRWFGHRPGEPWFRLALRSLWALVVFNLVFLGIPFAATVVLRGWPSELRTPAQLPMMFLLNIVAQASTIFTVRWLFHTLGNNPRRSRWIGVGMQALLWSLFAAAFAAPLRWSYSGVLPTPSEVADVGLSFAVGLSPFLVFGVWCMNHAKQHRQKLESWTTLAIDD